MGKRNSNHKDRLVTSTPDNIMLSRAVQSRFLDLCDAYLRLTGIELIPPASLDNDMLRWRQMAVRHRKGDFRNTDAEVKSIRTIAQWTVDENCKLRNQPAKVIDWGD